MQTTVAAPRVSDRPRWLAPASFLLILLMLTAVFSRLPASTGPLLDDTGAVDGAPVKAGVPFTWASIVLQNVGSSPIVILSATLGPHTPGVHLVGTQAARTWTGYTVDSRGYPRTTTAGVHVFPPAKLLPVGGLAIPGGPMYYPVHNVAHLIVGLRVDTPGDYAVRGMVITYRAGRFTQTERIGPILSVCVPAAGHKVCRAPMNVGW